MADYNLGRVQGAGFFNSSATSGTSIALSSISPTGIKPLIGDHVMFNNGDIRRVSAVSSTTVTCGSVLANFKGVSVSSIDASGTGFVFTLSDGSSITVPMDIVTAVNGEHGSVGLDMSDFEAIELWSGSWKCDGSSGSITVPNLGDYALLLAEISNLGYGDRALFWKTDASGSSSTSGGFSSVSLTRSSTTMASGSVLQMNTPYNGDKINSITRCSVKMSGSTLTVSGGLAIYLTCLWGLVRLRK